MKIKDLPKTERPREKLERYGPDRLSNSELLAILLRTGTKGVNVVEFSRKVLSQFGGIELAHATFGELSATFGLGKTKAAEILACFELGKRLLKDKISALLLTPHDIWETLKDIRDHKKEHCVVFFLDSRNQEIKRETVSIGTLNASLVHPREVFESAVRCSAAQIVIAHNHPSGDANPSDEDKEVTKRLLEAGKLMGIELLDHVIVCKETFFSFKDTGFF